MGQVLLFNDLTVGALPVNLLTFNAKLQGNTVTLDWATASESNSDYFEVIRHTEGNVITTIGRVTAAGNSNARINYKLADYNPASGVNYYQLLQYDKNGKLGTSSAIKAVNILEKPYQLSVTSATNGVVNFNIYSVTQKQTMVYVTNLLGQKVASKSFNLDKGNNTLSIATNGIGLLLLSADFKDQVLTKKFISQ